ncbi:MAG: hypothetical protein DRZ79_05095 [Candidatus Cloacimonadota bacterium]|nr:MAG: hypothetical protein DRZ79_05095 [Candidatus Cloacimonadota bacterium]
MPPGAEFTEIIPKLAFPIRAFTIITPTPDMFYTLNSAVFPLQMLPFSKIMTTGACKTESNFVIRI